jgi:hypothetical protein
MFGEGRGKLPQDNPRESNLTKSRVRSPPLVHNFFGSGEDITVF